MREMNLLQVIYGKIFYSVIFINFSITVILLTFDITCYKLNSSIFLLVF